MRRLVAGVVLAVAASAIAVPAQADEWGCHEEYRGSRTISVFCDERGRPQPFRVVAHCRTAISAWDQWGSRGMTNRRPSEAVCPTLVASAWVEGYHIDWL